MQKILDAVIAAIITVAAIWIEVTFLIDKIPFRAFASVLILTAALPLNIIFYRVSRRIRNKASYQRTSEEQAFNPKLAWIVLNSVIVVLTVIAAAIVK